MKSTNIRNRPGEVAVNYMKRYKERGNREADVAKRQLLRQVAMMGGLDKILTSTDISNETKLRPATYSTLRQ